LLETVRGLLADEPLPASDFMALALYHPEHGYYRQRAGRWGFDGKDYFTALDLGPLLGETVAAALHREWLALGSPHAFTVLEPGAGRGWLGRDILNAATGGFAEAIRYIHCDDNPAAEDAALDALAPWLESGRARLAKQYEEIDAFVGAVVSNELFDALPAQPWRWDGAHWGREVPLSLEADGSGAPGWETADPGEAGAWFAEHAEGGLQTGDGSVWAEGLPALLGRICKPLREGAFLAIDYGDSAGRLIAKGADIRRYFSHQVDGRWWENPGRSDLTADVDFSRLAHLLARLGMEVEKPAPLGRWALANAPLAAWEREWPGLAQGEREARKLNLMQLTFPDAMGDRFKAILARTSGYRAV
jgi:SAM-dependent MidA family methyltransferase